MVFRQFSKQVELGYLGAFWRFGVFAWAFSGVAGHKLPPNCKKCGHVRAFAVLHQRPEQDGEFTGDQGAESLIARAKRRRLGAVGCEVLRPG